MWKIELGSFPKGQADRISGFWNGAKAMLNNIPDAPDNIPMKLEFRKMESGNCHIFLVMGKWVGLHEASFD